MLGEGLWAGGYAACALVLAQLVQHVRFGERDRGSAALFGAVLAGVASVLAFARSLARTGDLGDAAVNLLILAGACAALAFVAAINQPFAFGRRTGYLMAGAGLVALGAAIVIR